MKFISPILFLIAMSWTWCLSMAAQPVPESVHLGVQTNLKRIITEYVQKNLATAKNVQFDKMWTEVIKKDRIKAVFAYTFVDENKENGDAKVQIEGFAILNKSNETADSMDWSFDELHILNNSVDYKDPIRITPGGPAEITEPPAATPAEPTAPATEHH